jgi:hypothetical protein
MTASIKRRLTCCCCGGVAGEWEQHWNRDTGYGVCVECVERARQRGESEENIRLLFGTEGVNWGKRNQTGDET